MTHEDKDYIQALRAGGYRVTPQRLIVLDAVCAEGGHATLGIIQARVLDMDPTIDRSTIYRALDVLCAVGLVVESEIGDEGKVYKIAGESDHHHLVCQGCGAIITVPHAVLAPLLEVIRGDYGFEVSVDHLTLPGRCPNCRSLA